MRYTRGFREFISRKYWIEFKSSFAFITCVKGIFGGNQYVDEG